MATFDVRRLPELYAPDPARLAAAQARQAAVWRGERPDRWPLPLAAPDGFTCAADALDFWYAPG
jgi:hypothetical protein